MCIYGLLKLLCQSFGPTFSKIDQLYGTSMLDQIVWCVNGLLSTISISLLILQNYEGDQMRPNLSTHDSIYPIMHKDVWGINHMHNEEDVDQQCNISLFSSKMLWIYEKKKKKKKKKEI